MGCEGSAGEEGAIVEHEEGERGGGSSDLQVLVQGSHGACGCVSGPHCDGACLAEVVCF